MVHRFPVEILTEIFSYAIIHEPRFGNARLDQAPLSVSQVCSKWRKASLHWPKLWTTLSLHVVRNEPRTSGKIIGLMTLWYGRAKGSLPLSFALSHYPKTISGSIAGEILKALIPFSRRLSHLYFNVPRADDLAPFLSQGRRLSAANLRHEMSPIPMLQKIEICVQYRSSRGLFSCNNVLRFAPALQDATINLRSDFCATSISLSFPWRKLTRLTLSYKIMAGLFGYLITQCLCLTHASFMVDSQPRRDDERSEEDEQQQQQNLPVVVAPNLSSLRLMIYGRREAAVCVENTMRHLVLPSMRNLDLLVNDQNVRFSLSSAILPLQINSAAGSIQLTRLVLVNIFLDSKTEFAALLHACTALETLALQPLAHHAEDVLDVLQTPTESMPVPTLPSLAACVLVVNLRTLASKLISILCAWAQDPERRRALKAVTVYASSEPTSGAALKELRERLGPWREVDKDGYVATAESGMVLRTRAVFQFFVLLGSERDWFEK